MRCEDLLEDLSAYADGELASDAIAVVERHLEACEACREIFSEYHALELLLGAETDAEPSPVFLTEVRERLRRPAVALPGRRRLLPGIAAAAASVLLLLGLIFMGYRDTGPRGDDALPSASEGEKTTVFAEIEEAVERDPELLEILETLDALERIELLENLPLLERLEEFESGEADALAKEAEILLPDREIPVDVEEGD